MSIVNQDIVVTPFALDGSANTEKKQFIELAYRINKDVAHWVPPLRSDVNELLNPQKNPFFKHADVQLFLAHRNGEVVGRISAHIDHLAIAQPINQGMGSGTGNWGMLEAEDRQITQALISAAEDWLRSRDMHRVLAPLSLSVWDEPGVLTKGQDHNPAIMMGHHPIHYSQWIAENGYNPAKDLVTYDLEITNGYPEIVNRIVKSGERSKRINVRKVDKKNFDKEAKIILDILNDAWSSNWGFVPLSDDEIAYVGKKLKPIVFEDLIMITEYDETPIAFMIVLPDINEVLHGLKGSLFPFGWAKLLHFLRKPKVRTVRVPLMGVLQEYQSSRLASQSAFMMIEYIRRIAVSKYGASRAEIGWILDDNQGMNSIATAIDSDINRVYTLYEKDL